MAHTKRLVISHLTLRRLVGILGILLPIIVSIGCYASGACTGVEKSISAYYDTNMRDIFVGILFVIGLFLYAYKGHDSVDDSLGNLGCVFALIVALVPTPSLIHFLSAAGLFSVFAFFCLKQFTKSGGHPTPEKLKRNKLYIACGSIIVICLIILGINAFFPIKAIANYKPIFVLEFIMLVVFGLSWLVKGETLWQDVNKA